MPATLRKQAPSIAVQSRDRQLDAIEPRCVKASIAVNSDEAVDLFFESVAEAGMSDKEAAYTMGMDPAQLSRVKAKTARLTLDATWRMPTHFWAVFDRRIQNAKGLTEQDMTALRAARIGELVRLLIEGK